MQQWSSKKLPDWVTWVALSIIIHDYLGHVTKKKKKRSWPPSSGAFQQPFAHRRGPLQGSPIFQQLVSLCIIFFVFLSYANEALPGLPGEINTRAGFTAYFSNFTKFHTNSLQCSMPPMVFYTNVQMKLPHLWYCLLKKLKEGLAQAPPCQQWDGIYWHGKRVLNGQYKRGYT